MQKRKQQFILAVITLSILLGGCATVVRPVDLKKPEKTTCLEVPQGLVAHEVKGLANFNWTTRLAQGPYVAELEDADGTYYRAPSGGIYIGRDDLADKPPLPLQPRIFEGGIWMPRVPGKLPHIYTYISTEEAIIAQATGNASCTSAVVVMDPQSKGVSAVAFATGGALGGATGGAIARATVNNSSISYGQAAGAGAIGGAISGVIIASIINMEIGKIVHQATPTDLNFQKALQELGKNIVRIPEASRASVGQAKMEP